MTGTHPAHWLSARGPANWFRLWHPPSWKAVDTDGHLRLAAPDGRGMLLVMTFWNPERQALPLEEAVDLAPVFARSRHVRSLRPLPITTPSAGWEAETAVDVPSPWWQKIFTRRQWQRKRAWVVRQGPLCVLAVFLPPTPPDQETEALAMMVLGTLEVPERPADPPAAFAERVLGFARRTYPSMAAELEDGFRLKLGHSRVNLFNFYRAFSNAPERFDEIIGAGLQTVLDAEEWSARDGNPPLDEVRDRVMPMLYPLDVWRENLSEFVGNSWVAGLTILYVVDEPHAYWYIRRDLLDRWGLSESTLHEFALENLDAYFERKPMEFTLAGDEDGPRLLMPNRPDAYNTSRLLSESFHRRLREVLGRECAVGLPGRDFFVAFNPGFRETESHVRQKVAEDFRQMDHPLTDRLLLITADGVSEFVPN